MKKTVLIIIMVSLLIGGNLYADGNLIVDGMIGIGTVSPTEKLDVNGNVIANRINLSDGGDVNISSLNAGRFTIIHEVEFEHPSFSIKNWWGTNPVVFQLKYDQRMGSGHLDTLPSGNFNYWIFGDSTSGKNKKFKVCGYPSEASSNECVSLRIEGANHDVNMSTEGTGSDILLMPQANVGIGTTSPSYPLEMASGARVTSGGVWTDASSRDYKENIRDLTAKKAEETLQSLNPVEYNYKVDKDETYIGFIAEDVPEAVAVNDRKGLSPMDIVAVLTKVTQEQQKIISNLTDRLNELEREVKLKGSLASVMN